MSTRCLGRCSRGRASRQTASVARCAAALTLWPYRSTGSTDQRMFRSQHSSDFGDQACNGLLLAIIPVSGLREMTYGRPSRAHSLDLNPKPLRIQPCLFNLMPDQYFKFSRGKLGLHVYPTPGGQRPGDPSAARPSALNS